MTIKKYIRRDTYLEKLILRRDNGEIKIVTGPRYLFHRIIRFSFKG